MRTECPNSSPECKYAPRCFADTHHIYGRPRSGTAKRFATLPVNKEQICRAEHDEINATFVHLPLPSLEVMKQIIREQP